MLQIIPLAALGLGVGIILNYLADTLPRTRSISSPTCVHCEAQVPLGYYLVWPQKCPECGRTNDRRLRSWIVDLTAVLTAVWLWEAAPQALGYPLSLLLAAYFILIVVVDVEHRLILIPTVIAGAVLGLVSGTLLHGLQATIIGGIVGYLIMFLLYKFGELFARWISRARGEQLDEVALGFGDVNLAGVLGLILGWPVIVIGLILAILIGGLAGFLLIIARLVLQRYRSFDAMPYAPYLIAAAALIIYFPEPIREMFRGFANLFGQGFL
ncbi:MAG: A24 family peptidase [Anaerolineales bacterium]|nr:A24 family peptidase [Anaerolineales bacterium]